MTAVVRKPCVLDGKKYNAGQMVASATLKSIKSANLGALYATGYLAEPAPGFVKGNTYIAGKSASYNGRYLKRGEVIGEDILKTIDTWRFKFLLKSNTIIKTTLYAKDTGLEAKAKKPQVQVEPEKQEKQKCNGCKKSKPFTDYNKDSKRKCGIRTKCRECESIARKKRTK